MRVPQLAIAGAVLAFLVVGGFLIFRPQGGGSGGPVTLNVTVTNASAMTPSHLTVHEGQTVTINMKSDRDGEVHLHGYDIPFDTKAGQVVSHTFVAKTTGDFDIEWESTSTHLGDLAVNP